MVPDEIILVKSYVLPLNSSNFLFFLQNIDLLCKKHENSYFISLSGTILFISKIVVQNIIIIKLLMLRFKNSFNTILKFRGLTQFNKLNLSTKIHSQYLTKIKYNFNMSNHVGVTNSEYKGQKFYVEQILTGCLALYSYYIESGNECFIIDPENNIDKYLEIINRRKTKLKGIFLTHYHADFIAGHLQLTNKCNCTIYMGPKAIEQKGVKVLKENQQISVGDIKLRLIHTPGHTQQSSCLLLIDGKGRPDSLFTGDTLFLGEVGRPDLAVKTDLKVQDLAGMLYQSIQKIKALDGEIRIYPGHGAGSSCGKSIGAGDYCTIANQKTKNYALKAQNKKQFIKNILNQMPNPPQYFAFNAKINKFEPFSFQKAYNNVKKQLTPEQVYSLSKEKNAKIIDVRGNLNSLKQGMIKDSVCVGFDGAFAKWIGTLFHPQDKYIIYGSEEQASATINRLLRIGYIHLVGAAHFPIKQWKDRNLPHYIPDILTSNQYDPESTIIDVRKPNQWAKGVLNAKNHIKCQLQDIFENYSKLDKSKKYTLHCAGGYRARIAYSILKSNGYNVKYYAANFEDIVKNTGLGIKN